MPVLESLDYWRQPSGVIVVPDAPRTTKTTAAQTGGGDVPVTTQFSPATFEEIPEPVRTAQMERWIAYRESGGNGNGNGNGNGAGNGAGTGIMAWAEGNPIFAAALVIGAIMLWPKK